VYQLLGINTISISNISRLNDMKSIKHFLGFQITSLDVGHPSYADDPTSLATSEIFKILHKNSKKRKKRKK
jgi:hypothetical protein